MSERPVDLPERDEPLFLIAVAPTIWAVHFLACYLTAAVWCAKAAGTVGALGPVRSAVALYTVIALVGITAVSVHAYRRHTLGTATTPHDFDTPADRHRFLGFATLLLALLSGVATLYVAIVALFFQVCG